VTGVFCLKRAVAALMGVIVYAGGGVVKGKIKKEERKKKERS
jgi:hypothetical protein